MILTTIWTLPCLHVSVRVEKILPPYYLKLIKVNILSVMAIFLLFTTIYIGKNWILNVFLTFLIDLKKLRFWYFVFLAGHELKYFLQIMKYKISELR